jgi:predicted site-specific integrase-resolvase
MPKAAKRPKKTRQKQKMTGRLLTLTEVAQSAGVSIPTAQTYKKKYQNRLPAVGEGRLQRYRPAAVAVFKQLREENRHNRGARRASSTVGGGQLLSLAEINRRTKISYPTLLRYVRLHGREIPSVGTGRARRFRTEAVQVFERLRSQSRKGRRPKSVTLAGRSAQGADHALADRIRKIEAMQTDLAQQLEEVVRLLKQPLHVTIRPE